MERAIDYNRPIYQTIKEAVKITGLSEYYFRTNLKVGNIPHIKSGTKILINIPRLLDCLENTSDVEQERSIEKPDKL